MHTRQLTPDVSVSGQIAIGDLEAIRAAGFRSVICNLPDGESRGQPSSRAMAEAAAAAGLAFHYLPVSPAGCGPQKVSECAALMQGLPTPILAYCRSGARSASLMSMAMSHPR